MYLWYGVSLCPRWLHAVCDGVNTEDEAECAVEYGYHCMLCRPLTGVQGPRKSSPLFF